MVGPIQSSSFRGLDDPLPEHAELTRSQHYVWRVIEDSFAFLGAPEKVE